MTDVWNIGSMMLDQYPRLVFLSFGDLEALHVSGWMWRRPEASFLFHVECKPLAPVVGLQKQACIATALVNLSLGIQLLNAYLLIALIMGTFLLSAADLWLFES